MTSISYIIYIHNHAEQINTLFRKLGAQEGAFRKEYIVVDDGSSDDSLHEIKKNIHYLHRATILSQEHLGSAVSLVKAMSITHNEYIFLISGDYSVGSNATQVMLNACTEYDVPAAFASGVEDKHYNHLINPLVNVVMSLDKNIGQIGMVPSLFKSEMLEPMAIDQHSFAIVPILALFWAVDYAVIKCPVQYAIVANENQKNVCDDACK